MKTRIITAIIGLIIVLLSIIYCNLLFIIVAFILALIGLFELIRMYKPNQIFVYMLFNVLFLIGLIYPLDTIQFFEISLSKSDVILLLGVFLLSLTVFTKNKFTFNDAGFLLITTMYIGLSFYYLIEDRKSTRLNSSHVAISYAVFCL